MIKIGNILIDPNDVSSIHRDTLKTIHLPEYKGIDVIQIVYKNGVVKNIASTEIGMSYSDFINTFLKLQDKEESDRIFRLIVALKSTNNG